MGVSCYERHTARRFRLSNGALLLNVRVYCFNSGRRVWNAYGVMR